MISSRPKSCWPSPQQSLLLHAALLPTEKAYDAFKLWRLTQSIPEIEPVDYQFLPLVYKKISPVMNSQEDKNRLRGIYKHNWTHNQARLQAFFTLFMQLPEHLQAQCLMMKGSAMILTGCYDVGARVLGDIDILVKKKYGLEMTHFFLQNGFKLFAPFLKDETLSSQWIENKHAIVLTKDYGAFSLMIDMHFSPLMQIPSSIFEESSWFDEANLVTYQEISIPCLNSADLLFQTCIHGMKYSSVPLFRWIMDAVTLIHHQPLLDWARFLDHAQHYRLMLPIRNAFTFLKQYDATLIPEHVFDRLHQLPVSFKDKVELFLLTHPPTRIFMLYSFFYSRSRRNHQKFFDFLSDCWGLSSKWQLPLAIFKKAYFLLFTQKKTSHD